VAAILVFVGFNTTFFVQFVMGSKGMPRRYYNYLPEFKIYHQISTVGAFLMGLAFVIMAVYLVQSLFNGKPAPANPWGSATLEWQTASPPPTENFAISPEAGDPYALDGWRWDEKLQGFVKVTGQRVSAAAGA